jgi:hypothetical protein
MGKKKRQPPNAAKWLLALAALLTAVAKLINALRN